MRRRDVIIYLAGAAAAWPLAARAQQQLSKPRRIGLLTSSSRPVSIESSYHAGILLGMRELGYVEGKDFIIEWRFAEGKLERFADFAAELVQLNVDVLVPATPTAIPAVRQATRTIPIVMGFSTDPVGNGFIASLAHPGGNITGLASSQDDAAPKQLEFLGMAVPNLSRLGLLVDRHSPNSPAIVKNIQDAARTAGVATVPMEVDNLYQIESAFPALANERVGAVVVAIGSVTFLHRERIAQLALEHRLPSMFPLREFVAAGGLMSYGESLFDFYRRAAFYVDKIFKGAKPADLPVEQPTRLLLVINRRTAETIGITIPVPLLVRADEVIE
ncbi:MULTISPECIES: ABC transporter substrate-binding protein [unclassified Bradyrhizobium]|uniref:ABC transporter substrate-binding protein n=1 Tax=unclassified Bradyrhizobium TaxID=2631580 RepID=UPI001BA471CA|nr:MULTISPECIES: ABC transporter substrate-binding protein [unclassified Bradyrhizobium]MBR1157225.1 ABC transporter substrate-binding protein [Bradyrhizobium sp. JYMT SZCCT0428]MBR1271603.1 ABC transporter substrate-binding protein [Bradyrhizobium sp. AUGA SZCCT0222]